MRERANRISTRPLAYAAIVLSIVFFTATAVMAGGSVKVKIDVSPELRAQTSPEQILFVFARAVRGPRAPLAVVRAKVSDLPLSITLDDSKAVVPMLRMSNFDEVVITARISKSGGAKKVSGDLEGISPAINTNNAVKPVHLVIDSVVK